MFKLLLKILAKEFQEISEIDANYLFKSSGIEEGMYWIYEFQEEAEQTECGEYALAVTVTGFSRNDDLEKFADQIGAIRGHFKMASGTMDGAVYSFWNNGGNAIPSGEENLDKYELYLRMKMWKG